MKNQLEIIFPKWMDESDRDVIWNAFQEHYKGYVVYSKSEAAQLFRTFVNENKDFLNDLLRLGRIRRNWHDGCHPCFDRYIREVVEQEAQAQGLN